ncbi:segregation and condensation protein A [Legionella geestiana]|uniref:Segregation and condensation protein A n=1 Tax=Legionella geestiana TaxID=45065 RepID=A0A0W0TPB0_9GAMM|nr:segregation/condensation protein A [Legionella geestiana]KTC97442.1 segregation and condensation protein A [Legionella geestiana]QBS11253.1 segregation/condensation protein A [Legionella geestiana]QDQ40948.1 segregation/condensation protein A [Legionella geestiana]STX54119.1 segregation and condensation protein A [Legionella geestiana]
MDAAAALEDVPVLAVVGGKPLTGLPEDLFIPPDALELLLDTFSGPMDLLLYLVRRQNLDILDLPIALITRQYLEYIDLLQARRLELAAEYLLMAAVLLEIKSRMLLPVEAESGESEEEDPRMELVRRLQDYEIMREAALALDAFKRQERDVFAVQIEAPEVVLVKSMPQVTLEMLVEAMESILTHEKVHEHHQIQREPLSVRERMIWVLERIEAGGNTLFSMLITRAGGRPELVVTLLALLELARQSLVVMLQSEAFGPITLQKVHDA